MEFFLNQRTNLQMCPEAQKQWANTSFCSYNVRTLHPHIFTGLHFSLPTLSLILSSNPSSDTTYYKVFSLKKCQIYANVPKQVKIHCIDPQFRATNIASA